MVGKWQLSTLFVTIYDVFSSLKIKRCCFYEFKLSLFLWVFYKAFRLLQTFIYSNDIYHKRKKIIFQPDKSVQIGASNEPCKIYMKIFDGAVTLGSKNRKYNRTPIQDLKDELQIMSVGKNCNVRESNPGLPRGRREFYH